MPKRSEKGSRGGRQHAAGTSSEAGEQVEVKGSMEKKMQKPRKEDFGESAVAEEGRKKAKDDFVKGYGAEGGMRTMKRQYSSKSAKAKDMRKMKKEGLIKTKELPVNPRKKKDGKEDFGQTSKDMIECSKSSPETEETIKMHLKGEQPCSHADVGMPLEHTEDSDVDIEEINEETSFKTDKSVKEQTDHAKPLEHKENKEETEPFVEVTTVDEEGNVQSEEQEDKNVVAEEEEEEEENLPEEINISEEVNISEENKTQEGVRQRLSIMVRIPLEKINFVPPNPKRE